MSGVSPAQITPVAAINLKHDRTIENIVFVEVFINPKVGQCCFWQDYLSTVKSNNRVPIIDYGFARAASFAWAGAVQQTKIPCKAGTLRHVKI